MIITLTPITRNQWRKVLNVVLWIGLSNGIALASAYLSNNLTLIAFGPAINIVLVTLQKIFQTEESQAVGQLPPQLIQPAQQLMSGVAAIADPITFTPANRADQNIGSTANS